MSYDISIRFIPREQRRGSKGEAWVFHPAKGKGRRKNQNIIFSPNIWTT